jgi:ArsR family transcriptional regulator, arsenate/arsenite/antimonite-responsive transcriptional repressor
MGEARRAVGASGVLRKAARRTRAQEIAIFKALADPHRFELLQQIAEAGCPLGCSQALSALPISPATLSHHVKELEAAGLIDVQRRGKFAFLTLRPGVLEAVAASLSALETAAAQATEGRSRTFSQAI